MASAVGRMVLLRLGGSGCTWTPKYLNNCFSGSLYRFPAMFYALLESGQDVRQLLTFMYRVMVEG